MIRIEAPFTQEQVDKLNDWQEAYWVHPFTCGGSRSDEAHRAYAKLNHQHDYGILKATADGLVCPVCGYTQGWAHDMMAKGPPPNPLEEIKKMQKEDANA